MDSVIILWVKDVSSRCRTLCSPGDWRGLKRFGVAVAWIYCPDGTAAVIMSNGLCWRNPGGQSTGLTGLSGGC